MSFSEARGDDGNILLLRSISSVIDLVWWQIAFFYYFLKIVNNVLAADNFSPQIVS